MQDLQDYKIIAFLTAIFHIAVTIQKYEQRVNASPLLNFDSINNFDNSIKFLFTPRMSDVRGMGSKQNLPKCGSKKLFF